MAHAGSDARFTRDTWIFSCAGCCLGAKHELCGSNDTAARGQDPVTPRASLPILSLTTGMMFEARFRGGGGGGGGARTAAAFRTLRNPELLYHCTSPIGIRTTCRVRYGPAGSPNLIGAVPHEPYSRGREPA